jgi:hypothetical protein
MRKFSLSHQFVVLYVLGPESTDSKKENNGSEVMTTAFVNNSPNAKWRFYKQLN